jgi:RNA polymerase sigma-70 factor (ECF subfamily)
MTMPAEMEAARPTGPADWLDAHGDFLFRFALGRVRDEAVAEDLVQETFLAALKARNRFAGRSEERTWLAGILKHKVFDHYRARSRRHPPAPEPDADPGTDGLFNRLGKWATAPAAWDGDPAELAEQAEFLNVLRGCLRLLPERLRSAVELRQIEQQDGAAVCETLQVTPNHLGVLLHRARLRLWQCLGKKWFDVEG